jgi:hypothetical protein
VKQFVHSTKENIMSAFVSKITEITRNAVRSVTELVHRSPWVVAAAAAVLVMLFLA